MLVAAGTSAAVAGRVHAGFPFAKSRICFRTSSGSLCNSSRSCFCLSISSRSVVRGVVKRCLDARRRRGSRSSGHSSTMPRRSVHRCLDARCLHTHKADAQAAAPKLLKLLLLPPRVWRQTVARRGPPLLTETARRESAPGRRSRSVPAPEAEAAGTVTVPRGSASLRSRRKDTLSLLLGVPRHFQVFSSMFRDVEAV